MMDLGALTSLLRPMPLPGTFGALPGSLATSIPMNLSHFNTQHLLAFSQMEALNMAAGVSETTQTPKKARMDEMPSPVSSSSTTSQHLPSPLSSPRRKTAQPIPEEKKDNAYFERRKKNNDAAKRSRDTRRMKEEATATRAQLLEHENAQLRGQLTLMKSEMANIQLLLLSQAASSMNLPLKTEEA